ncbi:hypothetical protein PspLS_01008, partial [Pyricularia sp. CBS 133598]
ATNKGLGDDDDGCSEVYRAPRRYRDDAFLATPLSVSRWILRSENLPRRGYAQAAGCTGPKQASGSLIAPFRSNYIDSSMDSWQDLQRREGRVTELIPPGNDHVVALYPDLSLRYSWDVEGIDHFLMVHLFRMRNLFHAASNALPRLSRLVVGFQFSSVCARRLLSDRGVAGLVPVRFQAWCAVVPEARSSSVPT